MVFRLTLTLFQPLFMKIMVDLGLMFPLFPLSLFPCKADRVVFKGLDF
jgi:hypothetical protein